MLTQNIFDPTKLPSAVWQLFFLGAELSYNNTPVKVHIVKMKAGGTIKRVTIGDYTYLEQNPNSVSQYGRMARAGHRILWIIHFPTERYVGRVIDGEVRKL